MVRIAASFLRERVVHQRTVEIARDSDALDQLKVLARLLLIPAFASRRQWHEMERRIVLGVTDDTAGVAGAFGQEHRFLGLDWNYLVILGLIGNAIFSMRFLVQWFASERQGESIIPVSFWYWSIAGSVIMCLYFVFRRDPVGILAYLPNSMIYIRNLMLIRRRKFAYTAAAPTQKPLEEQ